MVWRGVRPTSRFPTCAASGGARRGAARHTVAPERAQAAVDHRGGPSSASRAVNAADLALQAHYLALDLYEFWSEHVSNVFWFSIRDPGWRRGAFSPRAVCYCRRRRQARRRGLPVPVRGRARLGRPSDAVGPGPPEPAPWSFSAWPGATGGASRACTRAAAGSSSRMSPLARRCCAPRSGARPVHRGWLGSRVAAWLPGTAGSAGGSADGALHGHQIASAPRRGPELRRRAGVQDRDSPNFEPPAGPGPAQRRSIAPGPARESVGAIAHLGRIRRDSRCDPDASPAPARAMACAPPLASRPGAIRVDWDTPMWVHDESPASCMPPRAPLLITASSAPPCAVSVVGSASDGSAEGTR